MRLSASEKKSITVELDSNVINQVRTLAKKDRKNLQNEAVCLLEKGLFICETIVTNLQSDRKICSNILFKTQVV